METLFCGPSEGPLTRLAKSAPRVRNKTSATSFRFARCHQRVTEHGRVGTQDGSTSAISELTSHSVPLRTRFVVPVAMLLHRGHGTFFFRKVSARKSISTLMVSRPGGLWPGSVGVFLLGSAERWVAGCCSAPGILTAGSNQTHQRPFCWAGIRALHGRGVTAHSFALPHAETDAIRHSMLCCPSVRT